MIPLVFLTFFLHYFHVRNIIRCIPFYFSSHSIKLSCSNGSLKSFIVYRGRKTFHSFLCFRHQVSTIFTSNPLNEASPHQALFLLRKIFVYYLFISILSNSRTLSYDFNSCSGTNVLPYSQALISISEIRFSFSSS